jgi:serine/threonine protein phosphatase PrpC
MELCWAAHTHVGRRAHNEDHHLADERAGLFAVADGMGGYEGGAVASRIAVECLRRYFDARGRPPGDEESGARPRPRGANDDEAEIGLAVRAASSAVHRCRRGRLASMGTTLAALWLHSGSAVVGHVGDSRVYRLRRGRLVRLTRDHSLAELVRERGADEATARRVAHLLTRSLGQSPETVLPDLRTEDVTPGDVFLLCSDGLTDVLGDDALAALLGRSAPADAAVDLVEAAYAAGSGDNITAVVVEVR